MIRKTKISLLLGMVFLWFIPQAMAAGDIDVEITTHLGDKQVYREGDEISFLVSIDRDAYLLVIYQDAEGNLIQIIPNHLLEQIKYKQGMFLPIPSTKAPFIFNIQAPYGEEVIWIFAASEPFPSLTGTTLENGVTLLEGTMQKNTAYLRDSLHEKGAFFGKAKAAIFTKGK